MEESIQETMKRMFPDILARRTKPLNDSEGIKPYKCPICRDSGWIEAEMENGYTCVKECKCGKIQRERINGKLKFATIPKEFEGQTVDNFMTDCYLPQNRELAELAKAIAKSYVEKFDEIQETGKGLYFYSSVKGSGKTRLAVSIANDLIEQKMISTKFATTIQILDQIKATWGDKRKTDDEVCSEQKLINDIISVPVLVIDDIGVEGAKDWVNERFYNILNGRMIEKRITIFTSNCRIEDLKLDERIVNRIIKMALPVEFPNESIRVEIARKENRDLLDLLLGT
jgi:DNA replication protein DnaC